MEGTKRPGLLGMGLILLIFGCSGVQTESPLRNARTSPEALAEAALGAVSANEDGALASLMITREEYEDLLWPALPDRNQMPFDFAWSLTGPRSRKARAEVLGEFGGLALELVSVDLGQDIEKYPEFTLYRDARMTVRRLDTGQEGRFPLMDVLVDMGGAWKFLNFVEDV
jgi:hypothetical protein